MASLENLTIAATYDRLLALPSGGGDTSTLVALTDGNGTTTFCLQLSTTKAMIAGSGNKLYFSDEGGEYISGNGSALAIDSAGDISLTCASGDVKIPVNIGLIFGDGAEKIESDNTNLTLTSGVDINLTATTNINIPQAVKLTFDSDDTYIVANAEDPEDLVIAADRHIILEPDNNVGIGTATPGVNITNYSTLLEIAGTDGNDDAPTLVLRQTASAINAGTDCKLGAIKFAGMDIYSSEDGVGAMIQAEATQQWNGTTNDYPAELQFWTNADGGGATLQRMVIDRNGGVGIGEPTPDEMLHLTTAVDCTIKIESGANYEAAIVFAEGANSKWRLANDGDAADDLIIWDYVDGGSQAAHISTSDTAWQSGSDLRIKKDIENIDSVLDSINSLRPVTYKRKYAKSGRTHPGLIAQEVLPHIPLVVGGTEDSFREVPAKDAVLDSDGNIVEEEVFLGYKGGLSLGYSNFVPYLIKAIQELSAKVTALENA
jgi:hypothetical protein